MFEMCSGMDLAKRCAGGAVMPLSGRPSIVARRSASDEIDREGCGNHLPRHLPRHEASTSGAQS